MNHTANSEVSVLICVQQQQWLMGVVVLTAVCLLQPLKLIYTRPSRSEATLFSSSPVVCLLLCLYNIFMFVQLAVSIKFLIQHTR